MYIPGYVYGTVYDNFYSCLMNKPLHGMIKIEFNAELDILEVSFKGDIRLNDMLEYGEMIKKNVTLPRNLKILTDATKANYQFSPTEIREMMKALKEQIKPYLSVKTAVIQNKPVETALSMLVDDTDRIIGYDHKVFSSREAALNWLLKS